MLKRSVNPASRGFCGFLHVDLIESQLRIPGKIAPASWCTPLRVCPKHPCWRSTDDMRSENSLAKREGSSERHQGRRSRHARSGEERSFLSPGGEDTGEGGELIRRKDRTKSQAIICRQTSRNRAFKKSEKKPQNPLKPLFPGVLFLNPLQRRTLANRRFDEAQRRKHGNNSWRSRPNTCLLLGQEVQSGQREVSSDVNVEDI